jgi:SAM-dependent methyltransferase
MNNEGARMVNKGSLKDILFSKVKYFIKSVVPSSILRNVNNKMEFARYTGSVALRLWGQYQPSSLCPVCGFQGYFKAWGHPPRYGALCPACGSLERHRLLILANQKYSYFNDKDVLHFAPEPMIIPAISRYAKKYVSADLQADRAMLQLNIENISLASNSFDVVLISHVLEHVDDVVALKELYRIIRNEGKLLVMVPMIEGWSNTYENHSIKSEFGRYIHFGQEDHVRFYGQDIRNRVENAGFAIEEEITAFGADVVTYSLWRGEKLFVFKRKNGVL